VVTLISIETKLRSAHVHSKNDARSSADII